MISSKKILVFTLDAGFGHRKAAKAIADAFQSEYGGSIECKVINPLKEDGITGILNKSQKYYDETSRDHRGMYQAAYETINRYPISLFADQLVTQLIIREVLNTLIAEKPDGIISTFPIFNTPVRRVLDLLRLHIPFFSVVTDLENVHRLWFQGGPDKYLVASEHLKAQAINTGVKQGRVFVSGIPVDIRIPCETRDKAAIRRDLGWDLSLPTVVAIGSKRVSNFYEKLCAVEACGLPVQLCVVAGGDESLYKKVSSKEWKIPTHSYNYVENVPELLMASDILISKAGGLITSEGLACGLPIMIIDCISGQETGNVNYVLGTGSGVLTQTCEELQRTLIRWLSKDQKILKLYSSKAEQTGKPEAAFLIAQLMKNDMDSNRSVSKNTRIWNTVHSLSGLSNLF